VLLKASGRAAHSSFPDLGESAIDKLIDVLMDLRTVDWPDDPLLGRTHYTVGLISGGVAPNVVSPAAQAELMFRTVSDASEVMATLRRYEPRVAVEPILEVPPVRLTTVEGFASEVFPYTTDIPFLGAWGQPLLFGPGSIHVAHTADEYIDVAEQQAAVDDYVTIARQLLARE
jgi:acetylornithine deacetylase